MGSATEQRMRELLTVTSELAATTSLEEIVRLVVETGRSAVGAAWSGVWMLADDGKALEMVGASLASHVDAHNYERVPLDGDTPAAHVMRTDEPLFLPTLADYKTAFPASYERIVKLVQPYQAIALVPMHAHGTTRGVMAYSYPSEHVFEESERMFQTLLARQCALALDRLRISREERMLRESAELLYELIASVNRLESIEDVFALVLRGVMRGTKSDRAAILLFDADGVLRFEASEGLSDSFRAAVDANSPWTRDDIYPAPIAADAVGLALAPIISYRGQLLGQLALYRDVPRPFTGRELQLTATIAVHVAQAVERKRKQGELARAYREEHEARLLADEATRAREEILSVVSHDLRNPLGAILMCTSALLNIRADDSGGRVRSNLERIHRQAERMARYISDLVDFAGIEAGRIRLERREHKVEDIVSAASEMFGPIAQERGLTFQTAVLPDLPAIECDSERAVQVLTNLVANALKVTPNGGAVSIGAEAAGSSVVFFVRDTGPGIEQDELPHLFERHWRSKSISYKGAGLGLSIARGIVSAHGGRIWAESQVGAGSTFYFSLTN